MSATTHNIAENLSAAIDEIRAAAKRLVKWWQCRPPIIQYTVVYSLILTIVAIGVLNTFALNLVALGTFLYLAHQAAHIIHNRKFLKHIWIKQNDYTSTLLHYQALKALATDQQLYPLWLTKRTSWKHHQQQPKLNSFPSYLFPQISIISAFLFCLTMLIIQAEIGSFLPALSISNTDNNINKPATSIHKMLKAQGKTRVYQMGNGNIVTRTGGSLSWRDNNPGNLKFEYRGDADKSHNVKRTKAQALASAQRRYKGVVDLDQWGSLVFDTYESGRTAKAKLLKKKHGFKTIKQMLPYYAISDYSGKANHARYAQAIYRHGDSKGINLRNRRIRDFKTFELNTLMDGMKKFEGWKVGQTTVKSNIKKTPCISVSSGKGNVQERPAAMCLDVKIKMQAARIADKLKTQQSLSQKSNIVFVDSKELVEIAQKEEIIKVPNTLNGYYSNDGNVYLKRTKFITPVSVATQLCNTLKTMASRTNKCTADIFKR